MNFGNYIEYYGLPLLGGAGIILLSSLALALSAIILRVSWLFIRRTK